MSGKVSPFETAAEHVKNQDGGMEVLKSRYNTIRVAVYNGRISPTVRPMLEAAIRAKTEARELQAARDFQQEVDKAEAEAERARLEEVASLEAIPTMSAEQRAAIDQASNIPADLEFDHPTPESARHWIDNIFTPNDDNTQNQ